MLQRTVRTFVQKMQQLHNMNNSTLQNYVRPKINGVIDWTDAENGVFKFCDESGNTLDSTEESTHVKCQDRNIVVSG